MTILELIEQSAARLEAANVAFGHGTACAFDEAAWLVLWSLQLPLDDLDSVENRPVAGESIEKFAILLEARITTRRPAAYLTGEAWLQGVPFYIDERAIVPRSFIAELLADGGIDPWLPHDGQFKILDLCTGNGSLAVLAAMAYPTAHVDAADLSASALEVARINIDKHGLQTRISLLQGDGLAACAGRCYDLVLCNPPYVNGASMAALPAEYLREPALALAGGADGMDFVRPLLQLAAQHLTAQGVLVLEIGNERAYFEAAFGRLPAVWLETSAGADQVLLLERADLLDLATAQAELGLGLGLGAQ